MRTWLRQMIQRPEESQTTGLDAVDELEVEPVSPVEDDIGNICDPQQSPIVGLEREDDPEFETVDPEDCISNIGDGESQMARLDTVTQLEVETFSPEEAEVELVDADVSVCDSEPHAFLCPPQSIEDELRATKTLLMREQCRNRLRIAGENHDTSCSSDAQAQFKASFDAAMAESSAAKEQVAKLEASLAQLQAELNAVRAVEDETRQTLEEKLQQVQDELSCRQAEHDEARNEGMRREKQLITSLEQLQADLNVRSANMAEAWNERETAHEALNAVRTLLHKKKQDELSRRQTKHDEDRNLLVGELEDEKNKRIALEVMLQETKQKLERTESDLISSKSEEKKLQHLENCLADERRVSADLRQQLLLRDKTKQGGMVLQQQKRDSCKRKMDSPFRSVDFGSIPKRILTQFFATNVALESFDLKGIASYILEQKCKRIVVMCGAGISTSSGIVDFRTPGSGLYANLQKFKLPSPEAIFTLEFFRTKPAAFYELAKDLWPGNYEPSLAHYFIKLLSAKGILLRCYSQNFDSLESEAGLPPEKLVAAHGNFDGAHVIDTDPEVEVDINELKRALDKGEAGWQGLRREKGNLVKPNIVFFRESLPKRFQDLHREDLESCDLLIVLGTSLVVSPFNELVAFPPNNVPRVLINRELVGTCDKLHKGFLFGSLSKHNWRDVFYRGDCDQGCRTLATALGWGHELERLIETRGKASISMASWIKP